MSDPAFTNDVFLSHSSKDKAVALDVAERLRAGGLHLWFDGSLLKEGDSIPAKIEEGWSTRACSAFQRMRFARTGRS